jgi:hypothetical protein
VKALSVIMPWPWFIFKNGKDVENRTWPTNYRGRILIHASKKREPAQKRLFPGKLEEWNEYLSWHGCIVGSVELADCVRNYSSEWAELGLFHWVLKNPVLFDKPIPAKGRLGLWEYTEALNEKSE